MNGAIEYIKQEYSSLKFSETYFLKSDPATAIATANFAQRNATAIFIHNIYFAPLLSGAVFSFLDQYNNVLVVLSDVAGSQWFPVYTVKKGSFIKITCTLATINFVVSYQYLMKDTHE